MREKYISFCKHEEWVLPLCINIVLLIVAGMIHGYVQPNIQEILEKGVLISFIVLAAIPIFSNFRMFRCYRLLKKGGMKKKAVVEDFQVDWGQQTGGVQLEIRFRLLDTDECFRWKESYVYSDLREQLYHYLGRKPEIDVIVNPFNHSKNYVLLQQVLLHPIMRFQKLFMILNILLLAVGIVLYCMLIVA